MDYLKRCWAEIDLDQLAVIYQTLRKRLASDCRYMAVVKADAYGHGDHILPAEMERLGVDWFAVSNLEEGIGLRGQGITRPILIFGATPPEYVSVLCRHQLTQTVYSREYMALISEAAKAAGVCPDVHVKIDTGMSRLGFDSGDIQGAAGVYDATYLRCTGIYTHFAVADEKSGESVAYTNRQFSVFTALCDALASRGISLGLRHCCNSAGTIRYPAMHLDMVRIGIAGYGLYPSEELYGDIGLSPIMSWKAVITMVKTIQPGTKVSYGCTFTAQHPMQVATVSIGYADGYIRRLAGRGRLVVHGQYAPIVGRVCMDQLIVDVTGISGVQAGDVAYAVGGEGEAFVSWDELARLTDTINYEKTCLVGRRVPRVFIRKGREVAVQGVYPTMG